MTHAYNRIDQRLSEFPEHLVTEAIKRQGFVISELVKNDIDTFRQSGKNVSAANQVNLEKIALLKASHFEKRRQEKIEAVLHEAKLMLKNPNRRPYVATVASEIYHQAIPNLVQPLKPSATNVVTPVTGPNIAAQNPTKNPTKTQ